MYVVFYVVFNRFTEKICPWHFRRWAGLCAHSRKKKSLSVVNFFEKSCILDACFLSENAPPSLLGAGQTVREKCPFGVFLLRIFPHSE